MGPFLAVTTVSGCRDNCGACPPLFDCILVDIQHSLQHLTGEWCPFQKLLNFRDLSRTDSNLENLYGLGREGDARVFFAFIGLCTISKARLRWAVRNFFFQPFTRTNFAYSTICPLSHYQHFGSLSPTKNLYTVRNKNEFKGK